MGRYVLAGVVRVIQSCCGIGEGAVVGVDGNVFRISAVEDISTKGTFRGWKLVMEELLIELAGWGEWPQSADHPLRVSSRTRGWPQNGRAVFTGCSEEFSGPVGFDIREVRLDMSAIVKDGGSGVVERIIERVDSGMGRIFSSDDEDLGMVYFCSRFVVDLARTSWKCAGSHQLGLSQRSPRGHGNAKKQPAHHHFCR